MADVSAAAAALGIPEALVERSVEARAAASGTSVEELLAAWAGGEAPPAPAPADETPSEPDTIPETEAPAAPEPAQPPAPPEIVVDVPKEPEPAPTSAGPYRAPVLVGVKDNPTTIFAGVLGLFLIVVMVGLVGPSIPFDEPGARTSEIGFTEAALEGQSIYLSLGCASCHTQMVRPIVADVGLGPVTLDDTDQVLGTRRFGPDLANVGARMTASQIAATIGGLGDHPAHDLSNEDMEKLVAYLTASAASAPTGDQS